jgi:hypothetical protein
MEKDIEESSRGLTYVSVYGLYADCSRWCPATGRCEHATEEFV